MLVPDGIIRPVVSVSYIMATGPVLVVEEAGVPGENHRPWVSNW
jgi:hypothetical protein